jgi:hypothetical protein
MTIPSQLGIFLLSNQFSTGKSNSAINKARNSGIKIKENKRNTKRITTAAIMSKDTLIVLISLRK